MLVMFSLILSPPLQLSLLAVQITLRSLCENDHMTYATVYVTHANSSKKKNCSLVPMGTVSSVSWERDRNYYAAIDITIFNID